VSYELTPTGADIARGLPRPVQRAADQLDAEATLYARRIHNDGVITQVALFTVAALTKTQVELQQLVPEAGLRLAAVADAGTGAIVMGVARLGMTRGPAGS
jgi:hypothetical protein